MSARSNESTINIPVTEGFPSGNKIPFSFIGSIIKSYALCYHSNALGLCILTLLNADVLCYVWVYVYTGEYAMRTAKSIKTDLCQISCRDSTLRKGGKADNFKLNSKYIYHIKIINLTKICRRKVVPVLN
jgi:hypothetical protein